MTSARLAEIIASLLDGEFLDEEEIWLSASVDGKGIRVMVEEVDENGDAGNPSVFEVAVR